MQAKAQFINQLPGAGAVIMMLNSGSERIKARSMRSTIT